MKSLIYCPTAVRPGFEPKQVSLRTHVLPYVNYHTTSSDCECVVLAAFYLYNFIYVFSAHGSRN